MRVIPDLANGDWNMLREILFQLSCSQTTPYSDGSARETTDYISFVFKRAATQPATPTGDDIPDGWYDAPPADDGNFLWFSKAYLREDGTLIGSWSTPIQLNGSQGETGEQGIQGNQGVSFSFKGSYANETVLEDDLGASQDGWCYRNTTDNTVYVYDSGWELMLLDGNDGTPGTDGDNGLSVFITYCDNAIDNTPGTPSGDGTTSPWHTTATSAANWISQKVATSASSGTWGSPILIKGDTGDQGIQGDAGNSMQVQYSADGTNWHDTFADGTDIYMRVRIEDDTWSDAIRIVGEKGDTGESGSDAFENIDFPVTTGFTWTNNTGDKKVSWSTGTLKYKGVEYTITANSTGDTNRYIYWDKNSSNTTFKTTDTGNDILGVDQWLMCLNDEGVAVIPAGNRIIHAGLIQASTLSAISANLGTITSGEITLSLGGDAKLKISTSGLQVSDDAGVTWKDVIANNSGVVTLSADAINADTFNGVTANAESWNTLKTLEEKTYINTASGTVDRDWTDQYFYVEDAGSDKVRFQLEERYVSSGGSSTFQLYLKNTSGTKKWTGTTQYPSSADWSVYRSPEIALSGLFSDDEKVIPGVRMYSSNRYVCVQGDLQEIKQTSGTLSK